MRGKRLHERRRDTEPKQSGIRMNQEQIATLSTWLVKKGLAGLSEPDMLAEFCVRCRAFGLELSRGLVIVDTLHPIYEGRAFRWQFDAPELAPTLEYGRTDQGGEAAENWQRSPLYALFSSAERELRRRLTADHAEFPGLAQMHADGERDYFALIHRFSDAGIIGEMDGIHSQWMTKRAEGFSDDDLDALRQLVPVLGLAVKSASLGRIAETLVEVYLGRDAGQRVLRGRILRGVAERISTVLWLSDLHHFSRISDTADPEEIIPLLNDYADAVISAVHESGGDVLKLMGDGTLAIFSAPTPSEACGNALAAERRLRAKIAALNGARAAAGRPVTSVYLALHVGEVFYGNIGSEERLDFTVVGPAVNEVSRMLAVCRSVERDVIASADFAATVDGGERERLVSVGRFALRGFGQARDLYTLDPGLP